MSWRDSIVRALMGKAEPIAAAAPYAPARAVPYFDLAKRPQLTPQADAASALAERYMNPAAAEQGLYGAIGEEANWANRVRTGEQPNVVKGQYEMWQPADPVADTAHLGSTIQQYQDALRFLQNSQPISSYGVQ